MIGRVKIFARSYMPLPLMLLIRELKLNVNNKVSIHGNDKGYTILWASLASSCNYLSPAHMDKDGFISCLMYVPNYTPFNQKSYNKSKNK